jgi:hypothetical protein
MAIFLWWGSSRRSTHGNIKARPAEVSWQVSIFKHQSYIKTLSHFSFNCERNPETRTGTEKIQQKMGPSFASWWSGKVASQWVTEVVVSAGNVCRT